MGNDCLEEIVEPLLKWYKENARRLPWRENKNPYNVWISEIMLQQTRVEAVIPYYKRFLEAFPTVQVLAGCDEEKLMKLWEGLGYYSRARNLKKAAQMICAEYQGSFPSEFDMVVKLPGIGTYTAGAICSIAFEKPVAAVDGNVLRVITRLTKNPTDIMDNKFREEMKKKLEKVYPAGRCGDFTQSLMELGAMVCVPNGAPKCKECPLRKLCSACLENCQTEYPVKKKKAERKIENKTVFILRCGKETAFCKRGEEGILKEMWELPNEEGHLSEEEIFEWLGRYKLKAEGKPEKLNGKKHIFTHIEWHMDSYLIRCEKKSSAFTWLDEKQVDTKLALPTAFKKVYELAKNK